VQLGPFVGARIRTPIESGSVTRARSVLVAVRPDAGIQVKPVLVLGVADPTLISGNRGGLVRQPHLGL
jgi:hypothetical protein